jgi:acyl-CoA oxidase
MLRDVGGKLAVASTIAIRYSCVRRQGFVESSQDISYKSEERKILDYQVQQYRLFKQLATAFAIKFAGLWINKRFDKDDIGVRLVVVFVEAVV